MIPVAYNVVFFQKKGLLWHIIWAFPAERAAILASFNNFFLCFVTAKTKTTREGEIVALALALSTMLNAQHKGQKQALKLQASIPILRPPRLVFVGMKGRMLDFFRDEPAFNALLFMRKPVTTRFTMDASAMLADIIVLLYRIISWQAIENIGGLEAGSDLEIKSSIKSNKVIENQLPSTNF